MFSTVPLQILGLTEKIVDYNMYRQKFKHKIILPILPLQKDRTMAVEVVVDYHYNHRAYFLYREPPTNSNRT